MKLPNDQIVHFETKDGVFVGLQFEDLVRCKDCKHYKLYVPRKDEYHAAMMCFCPCSIGGQGKKEPMDYCSYGERKGQG